MAGKGQMIAKARKLGGFGGQREAAPLWNLSKRELVEAALHLAALTDDSYDAALESGAAARRVLEEVAALRRCRLL